MRTIYLKTNTKGIKKHNLLGNRKLTREHIIKELKEIYTDYKDEEFNTYKSFIEETRRLNEGQEWKKIIRNTKITIIKLELLKSKHNKNE